MTTDDSAEKVRRRMAELRRELECDVREVSRGASIMTDWRFYVRKFPWAVVGAAVVAGYFLVPKKKPAAITPDPEMLAKLIKEHKLRVDVESTAARPEKASMVKSLVMMGATWALRTGITYMTQRFAEAAQHKAQAAPTPDHEPGPSPLHEPWTTQHER